MYGGTSKLGRGGGRGGPRNRNSFPPPPSHRPPAAIGRLSLGGSSAAPRNRAATSAATPVARAPQAVEETFGLVPGKDPLAFSMIIRLAPDLVDEIRRVEAHGGTARIKFDSISNNTSGNVINVGGKEFKFTWSREFGDLCDIYEERQSGEDGNGLLVESGCAWRKLNVQRILDESTKNHLKMRSEEAERKTKSRKAIVLDPENPSMKNQIKQLAAVEANPWRTFSINKKEAPYKKRKVDPPQVAVGGLTKSAYKSGFTSAANAKGRLSASPLPSPPEQSRASVSPIETGNVTKSNASNEDVTSIKVKSKDTVASSEKDIPTRASSATVGETAGHRENVGDKPMDLQGMLITLLKENRKGMSLKALEKAVGDMIPNSARKIELIIKKIATFQAPGRYFLKQGVELESFKKSFSQSGSSPEENHQQTPDPEHNHGQTRAPVPSFVEKVPVDDLEEQLQPNSRLGEESNVSEKIDIQQHSPDLFGEKKVSDNSEGKAGSSSDSGSDSDSESDSSGSGSDSRSHSKSRSRSRSRSPVGSGSRSSSDSDSDASSNSKEGSDEDVDIMTSDDDNDPKHDLKSLEQGFSASPIPWKKYDGRPAHDGIEEKQDGDGSEAVDIEGHGSDAVDIEGRGSDAVDIEGHGSDEVDIERDLPDDVQEIEVAVNTSLVPNKDGEKSAGGTSPLDHDELQERQNFIGNLFDDTENMIKDSFRHEQSDSSERKSKGKSKRAPDLKHFDEKSEGTKRLKAESLIQPPISRGKDSQLSENVRNLSPNKLIGDPYKGSASQFMNKDNREGNAEFGQQRGFNQTIPGKSSSDFQPSGRRSFDQSARAKAPDTAERSNKHTESSGLGHKFSEKSFHVPENFPVQKDKSSRDTQKEDSSLKEKKVPRNIKDSGAGSKHSKPSDSHYKKHGEMAKKFKEAGNIPSSYMGSSPKDYNRVSLDRYPVNGRGSLLQRELSDLELGELREPLPEETVVKKQFERKDSFKHSENKPSTSENFNSDLGKGKPIGKATLDLGNPSPPNVSVGIRRTPEHIEDLTRPYPRVVQSQPQHHSRVDYAEFGSQCNKLVDTSSKSRQNESGAKQGVSLEGYGESHKKVTGIAPQQHGSKRGPVSHSIKESKTHISNTMADSIDGRKDTSLTEGNNGGRKKGESSSDEGSSSFLKYEKDEPELKGPIKDLSQYKEYVQEYCDKYDSYCSLNKILESYRNDFQKLGKDLEFAKVKDMERYYKILGQLKESYHQCGTRHKKLKKIFVVLHEELKHLKQRIKDYALSYGKD